jgi:2-phospho-L-lactate guanylyltransferase
VLAIVPVKGLEGAKSRLAPALSPPERADLVVRMLDRVLAACDEAASVDDVLVVTPHPELVRGRDVVVDEGLGQGPAVALGLEDPRAVDGVLVVMADCPLVTAAALDRVVAAANPLALVPAADGGTNALALRDITLVEPAFGVAGSAAVTVARAHAAGIEPAVLAEASLAFDLDRPADLARARELLAA